MKIMGEGKRRSGRESFDGARGNPGARGSLAPPVYPCDVGIRRGKYGRTRRRRTVGNHVECAGGADESRRLDGDLCSALHHGLCCLGYSDWFVPSGVRLCYKDTDKGRAVAITAQEQGLLE